jgi:hypothetical protein
MIDVLLILQMAEDQNGLCQFQSRDPRPVGVRQTPKRRIRRLDDIVQIVRNDFKWGRPDDGKAKVDRVGRVDLACPLIKAIGRLVIRSVISR